MESDSSKVNFIVTSSLHVGLSPCVSMRLHYLLGYVLQLEPLFFTAVERELYLFAPMEK